MNTYYTNSAAVQSEAGLENNTSIGDAQIQVYVEAAHAIVLSFVSKRYDYSALAINFDGSQAEAWLKRAETLIAAGQLINKEYGYQDEGENQRGNDKINQGMEMLKSIQKGDMILLDSNGSEYAESQTKSKLSISGYPTSSVSTNQDGESTDRIFTLHEKF